jgi:6-phosphogluconolactonase
VLSVYIGTYTKGPLSGGNGRSQGIYRTTFDPTTGRLSDIELAAACDNPSYLAVHPNGRFLYAVNEVDDFDGQRSGAVSAFAIEPSRGLRLVDRRSSHGADPCHLSLTRSGRHLLVANYHGASVSSYLIDGDGCLRDAGTVRHQGAGPHPNQTAPHPHYAAEGWEPGLVYVADLGLDRVLLYRLDEATGALTAAEPAFASLHPCAGPRHLAFAPHGRFAYVNNELASAVTVLSRNPLTNALADVQTIGTLPPEYHGKNDTAEIALTPDGRFAYVSNRGHDSLALFSVDASDGRLSARGHVATGGSCPRDFKLDPAGRFLLVENQRSDSIVVFAIDRATGALGETESVLAVPTPVCLAFLPPG